MSRSQGAANGGWPGQRYPAGEPDPRTGGRPAQRPQTQQAPAHQPQQNAPQYPAYPNPGQGYGEPQTAPPNYNPAPAYHYPQQHGQPQHPHVPQYAPAPAAKRPPPSGDVPRTAPPSRIQQQSAAPRGLSSLDSARPQPAQDFDSPRTQPPYGAPQSRQPQSRVAPQAAPAPGPQQRSAQRPASGDHPAGAPSYRQPAPARSMPGAPQYAQRPAPEAAPSLRGGSHDQWPAAPRQDGFGGQPAPGYDLGSYLPSDQAGAYSDAPRYPDQGAGADPLQQGEWAMPAAGNFGDPALDQPYPGNQYGYDQGHSSGALETSYNQDEAAEYEAEEPRRRGSWAMRIAGAVVVAVGLGYGFAQAYKAVLGPAPDAAPPVIESDASPARERPTEPGGREFAHTDSKVLGRLSEADAANGLSEDDADSGSRKVTTLVVGRDGSIAPPSPDEPAAHDEPVSVPGLMVVDAFGGGGQMPAPQQHRAPPQPQPDPEPVVVNSAPARSGVNVKSTKVIPASTASVPDEAPAPPKKQRVAAAAPATPPASTGSTGGATGANGYVAVLASVPASSTSRLDALRKFADMQQQYGMVLGNKTPDVRETNLAGKGPYHRLLVGPPGSRSQASELCTQLKASGYNDCWVTAY